MIPTRDVIAEPSQDENSILEQELRRLRLETEMDKQKQSTSNQEVGK